MEHVFFVVLVVVGFGFHLLATWPVQYASRIGWGSWFVASLLWAFFPIQ